MPAINVFYSIEIAAVTACVFFLIRLALIAAGNSIPDNFINYVLSNLSK